MPSRPPPKAPKLLLLAVDGPTPVHAAVPRDAAIPRQPQPPSEAGAATSEPRKPEVAGPRIGAAGPVREPDPAPPKPEAVLLDAGDLGPVERVLREAGARFEHIRVAPSETPHWPHPRRLLVMSAHLALRLPLPSLPPEDRVVTIALAKDGAETLTTQLARLGFRYLVGPGVHVEALRLLVEQALYRGRDQRRSPRLPLGAEVSWRFSLRRRHGTLVEISGEGARLHAAVPLEAAQLVEFDIPGRFNRGQRLCLQARILRVERAPTRESRRPYAVALQWVPRNDHEEAGLAALLRTCRRGPLARSRSTVGESQPSSTPGQDAERRGLPRTAFDREVITVDSMSRVEHALLGRDLSRSGMRVRPHPDLQVGQRVRVALYNSADADVLLLDAAVARDYGPRGLALHFVDVSASDEVRLQGFVARLPAVQALQPRTETVVLGRLLRAS
ncbi:MAG: PilZ domain-containing protein [Myxococcota bacterium]